MIRNTAPGLLLTAAMLLCASAIGAASRTATPRAERTYAGPFGPEAGHAPAVRTVPSDSASSGPGQNRRAAPREPARPAEPLRELPLPAVPDTLRTPQRRAAYILDHFWDAMDFADTLRTRDRGFMEQNLANYFSLFPHADTAALVPTVERLLHAAGGDRRTTTLLAEIAEKYLYEPDSPLYDESHYQRFLRALLRLPYPDAAETVRYRYQLASIRKNSPGTRAADFRYIDRQGRRRTLGRTQGSRLLLIFYDPACDHCLRTMERLAHDASLGRLIETGELTVLALFADGEEAEWRRSLGNLPEKWLAGLDISGVQEHELYVLRELPALYLLDGKKHVILKNTDPEQIRSHFGSR